MFVSPAVVSTDFLFIVGQFMLNCLSFPSYLVNSGKDNLRKALVGNFDYCHHITDMQFMCHRYNCAKRYRERKQMYEKALSFTQL